MSELEDVIREVGGAASYRIDGLKEFLRTYNQRTTGTKGVLYNAAVNFLTTCRSNERFRYGDMPSYRTALAKLLSMRIGGRPYVMPPQPNQALAQTAQRAQKAAGELGALAAVILNGGRLSVLPPKSFSFPSVPFHERMATVIGPIIADNLKPSTPYSFALTAEQIQWLRAPNSEYAVVVRCYPTKQPSTPTAVTDIFPTGSALNVNQVWHDKLVTQRKPPTYPLEITNMVYKSFQNNSILFLNRGREPCYFSVEIVRKIKSEVLIARLKESGYRSREECQQDVMRILDVSNQDVIVASSPRFSLLCPLSRTRMQLPAKGADCNHVQCFDAAAFLMMNERRPTWVCPVCDRPLAYDKLFLDGYFSALVNELGPDVSEFEIDDEGNAVPIAEDGAETISDDENEKEIIPLEIESSPERGGAAQPPVQAQRRAAPAGPVFIDLTDDIASPVRAPVPAPVAPRNMSTGSMTPMMVAPPHPVPSAPVVDQRRQSLDTVFDGLPDDELDRLLQVMVGESGIMGAPTVDLGGTGTNVDVTDASASNVDVTDHTAESEREEGEESEDDGSRQSQGTRDESNVHEEEPRSDAAEVEASAARDKRRRETDGDDGDDYHSSPRQRKRRRAVESEEEEHDGDELDEGGDDSQSRSNADSRHGSSPRSRETDRHTSNSSRRDESESEEDDDADSDRHRSGHSGGSPRRRLTDNDEDH